MRPRALGATLQLRPGTSDAQVAWYSLVERAQLPQPPLEAPRLIVDLGANIGVTMALFAATYPSARVLGVEPDPGNVAACRRNVAAWGERCTVVEAAVWPTDGRVSLSLERGREDAATVGQRCHDEVTEVEAVSLATLLAAVGGGPIDYVKMNVEGAEKALLVGPAWAAVRALGVEVHDDFGQDACEARLRELGFAVTGSRGLWVYARRTTSP